MLAALCHVSVDSLQSFINVIESVIEKLGSLRFDALERCCCLALIIFGFFEVSTSVLQLLSDIFKGLGRLPERREKSKEPRVKIQLHNTKEPISHLSH
jgi:hypothetical protein